MDEEGGAMEIEGRGAQGGGEESQCSKLLNSFVLACCVAPLVILGMVVLLGYNEKNSVCETYKNDEGKLVAKSPECFANVASAEIKDKLIYFACDLNRTALETLPDVGGDFSGRVPVQRDLGLKVVAQIKQCVESKTTSTKSQVVDGVSTKATVTTRTYTAEWSSSIIPDQNFNRSADSWKRNCNATNPSVWPSYLPQSATNFVSQASAGNFLVQSTLLKTLSLATSLSVNGTPNNWIPEAGAYTRTTDQTNTLTGIGSARVQFYGYDWTETKVTVLGKNDNGKITEWTSTPLNLPPCPAGSIQAIRRGEVTRDAVFKQLQDATDSLMWILRVVGLVVMWMGCTCLFRPLGVAADCIPYCGSCLGDAIDIITACIACPMACFCGMGVIGIVWVFMRPFIGIPLLLFFCIGMSAAIYWRMQKNAAKAVQ